ncbi:MAG TPA: Mur ligase domain-containing protein, partial [Daejeonella sp.]|nr:Mur ligase domain-containing protein [Daejeonella sp.]
MKLLTDILYKVSIIEMIGRADAEVSSLCFDSRKAESGAVFIAVRGTESDGHKFIAQAVDKGAKVVVCEGLPPQIDEEVTYVKVADSAKALGLMAANYFDHPSSQLKLVGITGTNGKTTVATLLFQLFRDLGYKVGLLSTVQNHINDEIIPATHTT